MTFKLPHREQRASLRNTNIADYCTDFLKSHKTPMWLKWSAEHWLPLNFTRLQADRVVWVQYISLITTAK
jgi:hypothetical protein